MWTQAEEGDGPSRQGGLTFQNGCLMPFGLHKGSGLSLMCALLAGGASGGGTEHPANQTGPGPILNHCFAVFIDPVAIESSGGASVTSMRAEMKQFIDYYKSSRPLQEGAPVLAPGEAERISSERRREHGIDIASHTWQTLSQTARGVGVAEGLISAALL
jgi:uncharacterized oxidoreductase